MKAEGEGALSRAGVAFGHVEPEKPREIDRERQLRGDVERMSGADLVGPDGRSGKVFRQPRSQNEP